MYIYIIHSSFIQYILTVVSHSLLPQVPPCISPLPQIHRSSISIQNESFKQCISILFTASPNSSLNHPFSNVSKFVSSFKKINWTLLVLFIFVYLFESICSLVGVWWYSIPLEYGQRLGGAGVPLKKTDSCSSYQLSIAPQLGMKFCAHCFSPCWDSVWLELVQVLFTLSQLLCDHTCCD